MVFSFLSYTEPLINRQLYLFQIIEVEMPFDKTKNQRKGFCFITFESEQVVNELLKTPKQTIGGKEVSIRFKFEVWDLWINNVKLIMMT